MFKGVPKIICKMQQLHSRKLRDARNVGLIDPILLRLLLSCSICWAVAGKILLDSWECQTLVTPLESQSALLA